MPDALLDAFQASRLGQAVRLELHQERRRGALQNQDGRRSRGERRQVQSRDGQELHPVRRGRPDSCA